MDYTVNVSRGKKTTSTPRDTDVDLTVSAQDRPAPGGLHGSSPAPSLIEDLPTPTKLENEQQGPNVGKTALPVGGASDKSTKSTKGNDGATSGDQEGLQVAFMQSELTCIREHVEKIAIVPQEIARLRNSL